MLTPLGVVFFYRSNACRNLTCFRPYPSIVFEDLPSTAVSFNFSRTSITIPSWIATGTIDAVLRVICLLVIAGIVTSQSWAIEFAASPQTKYWKRSTGSSATRAEITCFSTNLTPGLLLKGYVNIRIHYTLVFL